MHRIASRFGLPSERSYIGSHGYRLRAEGRARDATEPAGVRGGATGAVPGRYARGDGPAPRRGRCRDRPPPQGGDPTDPTGTACAGGTLPRGPALRLRLGRGQGGRDPVAGHRAHRVASAPSLRAGTSPSPAVGPGRKTTASTSSKRTAPSARASIASRACTLTSFNPCRSL